jgi:predicted RNA-binding Zn-ribbon protein involved in translation (DUF1610 family)
MKWKFSCPSCRAVLNPNVKVILKMKCGQQQGLILFSPRLGNYKTICDQELAAQMADGDMVEFSCPVCGDVLTSSSSTKLAEICMHQPGQRMKRLQFSRIYGEHATFILNGDTVTPLGKDSSAFNDINFFGV